VAASGPKGYPGEVMAVAMEVSFVRVRGQRDRIYVRRSDRSEVSWVFPSYGDELPHDLVHLVVEAAFGVRYGFWGRVDAGVDPARINDEANRMGGANKYRGFGDDRRDLLLAEALAAALWLNADVSDDQRRAAIVESCGKLGVELPSAASLERLREVRAALEQLRAQWRAIGVKGTLKLRFDPLDPQRSFAEIGAGLA
jgi:hypothetical protein